MDKRSASTLQMFSRFSGGRTMLKSIFFGLCAAFMLGLSFPGVTQAGDVVIITHPETTVSLSEVKEIFLGGKQFSGKIKLIPIDNAALQVDFLSRFTQMDTDKYSRVWVKKSFRDGLKSPVMKSDDREVIEYVQRRRGAIGYVSSTPNGVNIVR